MVHERGETLVLVPCWWDGSAKSLVASIRFCRPDLLLTFKTAAHPIPLNPVPKFFHQDGIPGIGELMLASFPSTTTQFDRIFSVSAPWWIGEKYDGVRFCWHEKTKRMYSRVGAYLPISKIFLSNLEKLSMCLDGEVWFGRGTFQESQELVNDPSNCNWPFLRMVAFDEPSYSFNSRSSAFEERYLRLAKTIPVNHSFALLAPRIMCTRRQQLKGFIHRIISDGGEGAILRKPGSLYDHGRSKYLIKLKAARVDREALVVTDEENGIYVLQMTDGVSFKVPTKHFKTSTKCKRGDIVTFSYDRYARNSIPINARVFRIRTDVTWEYLLREQLKKVPQAQFLSESTQKAFGRSVQPLGFWSNLKKKKMRLFFENIAKAKNLDPLLATTWYPITKKQFRAFKGGGSILENYNSSYVKAVVHLFPDISFDVTKFAFPPRRYWADVQRRRRFFETYAKENGFDPLIASHWRRVSTEQFLAVENAGSVLKFHNKNIKTALKELFPEIGVEKKYNLQKFHWENESNQRNLFIDFAAENKFDPLIAQNWYSVSADSIFDFKGGNLVLSYYGGGFTDALLTLFPNIGIDKSKFNSFPRKHWTDPKNRRKFFEELAQENGFDSLVVDNWYNIPYETVMSRKGAHNVLYYYNDEIPSALVALFPDINFDRRKFYTPSKSWRNENVSSYWMDPNNRKQFFLDFANANQFGPLLPVYWYSISEDQLLGFKDGKHVVNLHGGNFVVALLDLFPNIGLEESKFQILPRSHWQYFKNRRNFMEEFARTKGFDPLVAENWYSVKLATFLSNKWASSVLSLYGGNLSKALIHMFPETTFTKNKFPQLWKKVGRTNR